MVVRHCVIPGIDWRPAKGVTPPLARSQLGPAPDSPQPCQISAMDNVHLCLFLFHLTLIRFRSSPLLTVFL